MRLPQCLLLLFLASCQQKPTGTDSIEWLLDFATQRIQPEAQGWQTTSDVGYQIHVNTGTLTTWRLGLLPCPDKLAWLLLPTAQAHHLEPPDPTSILPHLVEDLVHPVPHSAGPRLIPKRQYCQGFWLVSAPPPAQAGLAPRVSLTLQGTWQKAGKTGKLDVQTWLPDAKLQPVQGLERLEGPGKIHVTRHLDRLFDGVDLAEAPTNALAWTLLHRLVQDAEWRVEPLGR